MYDFGRFYRLDEFATASTVIRRAWGRDAAVVYGVYGWGNDKMPINPKGDPKAVLQELINFAKDNIKIWESAAGTSQGIASDEDPMTSQEPSFNPFQTTEAKGKGKGKGKTKTKYWGNRTYQWKRQYGGGWFWE